MSDNSQNVKNVTKKQIEVFVKNKLHTDDNWAKRALVVVFNNQTESEQMAECTVEHNNVGFTGPDAELLSSFAKQLKKYGGLSPKQMLFLKRLMPKYHAQVIAASKVSGKLDMLVGLVRNATC